MIYIDPSGHRALNAVSGKETKRDRKISTNHMKKTSQRTAARTAAAAKKKQEEAKKVAKQEAEMAAELRREKRERIRIRGWGSNGRSGKKVENTEPTPAPSYIDNFSNFYSQVQRANMQSNQVQWEMAKDVGEFVLKGNYYSESPGIGQVAGGVVVSFIPGVDTITDIRDAIYHITHWKETTIFEKICDGVAFIPYFGAIENVKYLKYSDEIAEGLKYTDEAGEIVGEMKYTDEVAEGLKNADEFKGITVIKDDSLFDPNAIDKLGRTNIQRMDEGLAPIGYDGKSVNIHHIDQTNNGPVMEISASRHQQEYGDLHQNTGQAPSQIDRNEFNQWRNNYWEWRADDFQK